MGEDTPTAILTKGQREYLRGEKDPAQERTMKTRIRERVRTAVLHDSPLLQRAVDAGGMDPKTLVEEANHQELIDGLKAEVALVYQLARAAGLDAETIIQDGIQEGQTSRAEVLYQQYKENPASLTLAEYSLLNKAGKVDEEETSKRFRETLREPVGMVSHEELGDRLEQWDEEEREKEREEVVDAILAELEDVETLTIEGIVYRLDMGFKAVNRILEEDAEEIASLLSGSNQTGRSPATLELVETPNVTEIHLVDAE